MSDNTVIKARAPRYRTIPLFQTPRRGEIRPAPTVLPVDDPLRAGWSPTPGNEETTWVSMGDDGATPPLPTTRHGWPFVPVPADAALRHRPGTLDYALNVENLVSQIVPGSTGRGAVNPRRAGYDLIARIYSAKRWRISGTIQGQTIDETWGPYTRLSIGVDGTATEISVGGPDDGREMVPVSVSIALSVRSEDPEDDSGVDLLIDLTAPYAIDADGWDGGQSYLSAGLSTEGDPIIGPAITGTIDVREDDSAGDAITLVVGQMSPRRIWSGVSSDFYDVETAPITLCGYSLTYQVPPGKLGAITGGLAIDVEEFWGPDEWPS